MDETWSVTYSRNLHSKNNCSVLGYPVHNTTKNNKKNYLIF